MLPGMLPALWTLSMALAVPSAEQPRPRVIQVAHGIYLFITQPYSDVGLDGNSVAIISTDGVLVFDANGTPAAAARVLAEIRRLTPQPVRYLVYSHWHWDHWYGAEAYRRAFPGLQIIAQERERPLMMGPALAFNQPNLDTYIPQHLEQVERVAARAPAGTPQRRRWERHLQEDRFFLEQKRGVHHAFPNLTFADSLTIYLGDREIRVLHYDRAVTPGDAFLYLPKERVVVTGDLLINPVSFALDCYPSGWIATLERIDSLDITTIIPGHGEPLHDRVLLETHIALFRELRRLGRAARERGLDVEQARAEAKDSLHDLRVLLTHDEAGANESFDVYLVDWFLHRVYDESAGALTDHIEPMPQH